MYLLIFGVFMVASLIVSGRLKSKFRKYSKVPINYGLTGKEVAEKMLHENGIFDVRVTSVPGQLTDHYNPASKTVNLSEEVYHGQSVSAAAVAAHECGHAVQHANAYSWLQLRTALVPLQNVSAKILNTIFIMMFLGAFILPSLIPLNLAFLIIIGAYSVFTLFALITLPVEFDASRRALVWLNGAGITSYGTHEKAQDALRWAAGTYVVAALASIATLLYYVMMFMGSRD